MNKDDGYMSEEERKIYSKAIAKLGTKTGTNIFDRYTGENNMNKNTLTCPKCGSLAKIFLYSTQTLAYIPTIYDENGNLVQGGGNITTDHYKCIKCGEEFTHKC